MKQIIYNDTTYYFDKGKIFDDSFLLVPENISIPVLEEYYSHVDYSKFNEMELRAFINELKDAGLYNSCINVSKYGLDKYSDVDDFVGSILALITSAYRAIGQAQTAIDFWRSYQDNYRHCENAMLYTSLAAAYCDLGEYETAMKTANKSYAMQGSSAELSLVYDRIRKELGE